MESANASAKSSTLSQRVDGSRVPNIQTDDDPLNEIREICSVANPAKSAERTDDSVISELSEFPRDGGRVLSDKVAPTFHAVFSSNVSGTRVEDGTKPLYEGISSSAIKGAIWKMLTRKLRAKSFRTL